MRPSVRKGVYAGMAGLSLIGAVAGCAPGASSAEPANTGAAESPAAAPTTGTSSTGMATTGTGAASTYKDGTYSADGNYTSPNGTEKVGVELTLAAGKVSDVQITTHPTNPNTRKFQGEFADGIAAQIVGKDIDGLNVSKVAGSSLTSGGFNEAVEQIKSEAK